MHNGDFSHKTLKHNRVFFVRWELACFFSGFFRFFSVFRLLNFTVVSGRLLDEVFDVGVIFIEFSYLGHCVDDAVQLIVFIVVFRRELNAQVFLDGHNKMRFRNSLQILRHIHSSICVFSWLLLTQFFQFKENLLTF